MVGAGNSFFRFKRLQSEELSSGKERKRNVSVWYMEYFREKEIRRSESRRSQSQPVLTGEFKKNIGGVGPTTTATSFFTLFSILHIYPCLILRYLRGFFFGTIGFNRLRSLPHRISEIDNHVTGMLFFLHIHFQVRFKSSNYLCFKCDCSLFAFAFLKSKIKFDHYILQRKATVRKTPIA